MSLREVLNTERILTCWSLEKKSIHFREEGPKPVQKNDNSVLLDILASHESKIHELSLLINSKGVTYTISGYITKKIKHFQWEMYSLVIVGDNSDYATVK